MKKIDRVIREVLYQVLGQGKRFFKQKELAQKCDLSLGTINPLIQKLIRLGALESKPQGFRVVDTKRLLTYWSVTRDLYKDIIYTTYVPKRVKKIEADLPAGTISTGFTGYSKYFEETPTDYDEIYVYADKETMQDRFKPRPDIQSNLIILEPDEHLAKLSIGDVVPLAQLYVDLWQLGRPANRFVDELEKKMNRRNIKGLKKVAEKLNE